MNLDGELPTKETLDECEQLIELLPDQDFDRTEVNREVLAGVLESYRAAHDKDQGRLDASRDAYDETNPVPENPEEGSAITMSEDLIELRSSWAAVIQNREGIEDELE